MSVKKIVMVAIIFIFSVSSMGLTVNPPEEPVVEEVVEVEMIDIRDYWKEHPEECPYERLGNIDCLARVADATVPNGSDDQKIAMMELVLNRVDLPGFPNTIEEVCYQKNQWEGNIYQCQPTMETRKLAEFVYDRYELGEPHMQLIPTNCAFVVINEYTLEFRPTWESTEITTIY